MFKSKISSGFVRLHSIAVSNVINNNEISVGQKQTIFLPNDKWQVECKHLRLLKLNIILIYNIHTNLESV